MEPVIIIAEAGVNHNGSVELAKKMILAAEDAGVDYLKFQTFKAENLVNKFAGQAKYQQQNLKSGAGATQLEMLKKLELDFSDFVLLKDCCESHGLKFLSTPFDLESIEFLRTVGMDYMKVPSGEITNLPYLKAIARTGLPVIMSTGMCRLGEIEDALKVLTVGGVSIDNITLLHCNTEYPTPMEDVNLRAMETLKRAFGTKVGYSDHTKGIEVPIAAVAMGATMIEKHFTLDKALPGPDHIASLNPVELKEMVTSIRNIEKAIGSGIKTVTPSEEKNIDVARKSIVAARPITKGELFSAENITVKRPGNGISPMKWDEVTGKPAPRDFARDELIEL